MTVDGRAGIDAALVRRLLATQFPQWRHLPVSPVAVEGWDNRTYRLGDDLTVRLPTAPGYVPAVTKEHEWLPRLAPHLPVAIPPIRALGSPGEGYPFPWSVRGWLPGGTADRARIDDLPGFAVSVAEFIRALQRCDATGGPLAGEHSWCRGASPAYYDEETRRCLATLEDRAAAEDRAGTAHSVEDRAAREERASLEGRVDTALAAEVWEAALDAPWRGRPVWFHGDIASGNLLVVDGKLSAVIDFGTSGVGDPACDLVIAWTMFDGDSRQAFREAVDQDDAIWARARGWALWKALLVMTHSIDSDPPLAAAHQRVVEAVLADHRG